MIQRKYLVKSINSSTDEMSTLEVTEMTTTKSLVSAKCSKSELLVAGVVALLCLLNYL